MSKYKVGDKVRINGRDNAGRRLVGKIRTVSSVNNDSNYRYDLEGQSEGFCEAELDLVTRRKEVKRRTYRLIKDLPGLSKGLLVQEACDDGDQEYVSINHDDFMKFEDWSNFFDKASFSREEVEQNPTWFEEVEQSWFSKIQLATYKAFVNKNKKARK